MVSTAFVAAVFIAPASCLLGDPPGNEFLPPGPTDQRSACPYLNTLANHGFVKRSGAAVSRNEVNNAFNVVFNVDPIITDMIFTTALAGTTSQIPDTINYVDLNQHGLIEHDGSLSRDDIAVGNNFQFNQTIWNQMTMFFTTPLITIEQMATARVGRINRQRAANPAFVLDNKAESASLGESSLVLMTFSNGSIDGGANRQQVDTFFTQERLPFDQGYTVPTQMITADRVQVVGQKITNATGVSSATAGAAGESNTNPPSSGPRVFVDLVVCVMSLSGIVWVLG